MQTNGQRFNCLRNGHDFLLCRVMNLAAELGGGAPGAEVTNDDAPDADSEPPASWEGRPKERRGEGWVPLRRIAVRPNLCSVAAMLTKYPLLLATCLQGSIRRRFCGTASQLWYGTMPCPSATDGSVRWSLAGRLPMLPTTNLQPALQLNRVTGRDLPLCWGCAALRRCERCHWPACRTVDKGACPCCGREAPRHGILSPSC